MKTIALSITVAVTFILSAEWFFQTLEVRPSQYVAMTDYLASDPADRRLRSLISNAISDDKISSREYKPIVDHVLEKYGIYEQKIEVPHTVELARANLQRLLGDLDGSA